jgi:two-component system sensor histidine kinase BaeS
LRAQGAAAGVTITADVPAGVPALEIDPTRIHQVLTNLLTNALQHTPAGGAIQVTCRADTGNPPAVMISVADTGRGIPPQDLPHIFDRFYKSTASRGSGLGLAIARNLIALHGGQISAESTPGEGTTIRMVLPVAAPAAD